jgi:metal-responsive CopG/Arc/MetJ family transcriptional regulator
MAAIRRKSDVRKPAEPKATSRKTGERKSKVYTISLPPEMAKQAEAIAKDESRTMSELFREAFRAYRAERTRQWLEEVRAYASTRNPQGYTEEDVPRLVKEVRAELRAQRERTSRAAG